MTIQMYLQRKYKASQVKPSATPIKQSEHSVDLDINGVDIRCEFIMPEKPWKEKGMVLYHVITDKQKEELLRLERLRKLKGYGDL